MDKCAKHDEVMDRIFTEIGDIKLKVGSIDTKMDDIILFKNMVHEIIFGNGKPGLKGRVDSMVNQVNKQWYLIGLILTAALTGVVVHFWKG